MGYQWRVQEVGEIPVNFNACMTANPIYIPYAVQLVSVCENEPVDIWPGPSTEKFFVFVTDGIAMIVVIVIHGNVSLLVDDLAEQGRRLQDRDQ